MLEALQFEFMRNAVLAGIMASAICGVIGTLVVVNRIVFLAGGIAHAAYGGIGLAFFLGLPYFVGIFGFSILSSMIMAAITLKEKNRADTFIGVVWAVGMALGVILLDIKEGYNVDLMSYLFGSILTVPSSELIVMACLSLFIVIIVGFYYHDFLAMSYDQEFAQLRGVSVKPLYFLLIGMIALSVVMVIKVVGLILIIALLTIPPFIAEKYTHSLVQMMLFSAVLSIIFSLVGLWLSYQLNLTSGATIILVAAAVFFLSFLTDHIRARFKSQTGE
ncbi:MAG: metal ABC transporter permease [Desulfobacterales bacterium]|nr:metal ABC transporter permease [Desulfobacterales bacterium]